METIGTLDTYAINVGLKQLDKHIKSLQQDYINNTVGLKDAIEQALYIRDKLYTYIYIVNNLLNVELYKNASNTNDRNAIYFGVMGDFVYPAYDGCTQPYDCANTYYTLQNERGTEKHVPVGCHSMYSEVDSITIGSDTGNSSMWLPASCGTCNSGCISGFA